MDLETLLTKMVKRDGFVDVSTGNSIRNGYPAVVFNSVLKILIAKGYQVFAIQFGGRERFKILTKPGTTIHDILVENVN